MLKFVRKQENEKAKGGRGMKLKKEEDLIKIKRDRCYKRLVETWKFIA